jgi:uncharacterized protein (DUF2461 family)
VNCRCRAWGGFFEWLVAGCGEKSRKYCTSQEREKFTWWKGVALHCTNLSDLFTTTVHDPDYRTSWNDWSTFVESLTEKIIEKDETIPELPPKDLVFRIYRDIRFSSDPTPYKVGDLF